MGSHGHGDASPSPTPSPQTRRPTCAKCSKPIKLCLCSRFTSPPLPNSIPITVLQHSHEVKHPLNSTRVARLGFENISVVHVSDVNLHAQLQIHPLVMNQDFNGEVGSNSFQGESLELVPVQLPDSGTENGNSVFDGSRENPKPGKSLSIDFNWEVGNSSFQGESLNLAPVQLANSDRVDKIRENPKPSKILLIDLCAAATSSCNGGDTGNGNCVVKEMNKYKVICSPSSLNITVERTAKPNLNWVPRTLIGKSLISNGFQVKKLHTKKKSNSTEIYDIVEYDLIVPPNSVLLFPNEKSVGLDSVDFEVKNLIVLDGTWAKAQRMYHENPWLKLLPHVKLDSKQESLYSEVRQEPKSGCLSTIESIVFALKKFGEDSERLDMILGVFESMILDQRRCKDENFSNSSQT